MATKQELEKELNDTIVKEIQIRAKLDLLTEQENENKEVATPE